MVKKTAAEIKESLLNILKSDHEKDQKDKEDSERTRFDASKFTNSPAFKELEKGNTEGISFLNGFMWAPKTMKEGNRCSSL